NFIIIIMYHKSIFYNKFILENNPVQKTILESPQRLWQDGVPHAEPRPCPQDLFANILVLLN
ncbi:MAG: hypothetical protein ACUVXF_06345, partial [Desulfobaccales bacterium]